MNGEFPALLYDPVTGVSRRVLVAWKPGPEGGLCLDDAQGGGRTIPVAALSLARGGWRGDAVHLTWDDAGRSWAVTIDDPRALAQLMTVLPAHFATQIAAWRVEATRGQRRTAVAFLGLAILALLPLLVLGALYIFRDQLIDAVIPRLPTSVDVRLGELAYQQIERAGQLVHEGPAVHAVRELGERLGAVVPASPFRFRFEVLNDPSVNAFAAPGGLVVVHTGLLATVSSIDQLSGVLAHEVSHIVHRHTLRQMVFELGLTTSLRWLFGAPDSVADTIAAAALKLSALRFSREQESEADAGAVELLHEARLPATGLQQFFDDLAREHENLPALLSTHPPSAERSSALQRMIEERGPWQIAEPSIDWAVVRRDATAHLQKP